MYIFRIYIIYPALSTNETKGEKALSKITVTATFADRFGAMIASAKREGISYADLGSVIGVGHSAMYKRAKKPGTMTMNEITALFDYLDLSRADRNYILTGER